LALLRMSKSAPYEVTPIPSSVLASITESETQVLYLTPGIASDVPAVVVPIFIDTMSSSDEDAPATQMGSPAHWRHVVTVAPNQHRCAVFTLDRMWTHATDHFLHIADRCGMVSSRPSVGARAASTGRGMADQGDLGRIGGRIS